MKIENISFTFENCENITVEGKYIGQFLAEDIRTCFRRIGCNCINKIDTIHTFAIEIHKDANKAYCPFGDEKNKSMVFERLNKYDDITNIEFDLVDTCPEQGEVPRCDHYDYRIHWTGDSNYSNDSQKIYISELGNLYIVVDKNKGIDNFFDKEEINNKDIMDFHFDMCDVGDMYANPDRYKNA